jgi:hypothetical protein
LTEISGLATGEVPAGGGMQRCVQLQTGSLDETADVSLAAAQMSDRLQACHCFSAEHTLWNPHAHDVHLLPAATEAATWD